MPGELELRTRIEKTLKDYQIKCSQRAWMHTYECEVFRKYNKFVNITSITVTSLIATETVITSGLNVPNSNIKRISSVITVILLYFASILGALQHFLDYEKKAEEHRTSSTRFSNMGNNVKRTLVLGTDDKDVLISYFKWVSSEYENIVSGTPSLGVKAMDKFEAVFGLEIKQENNDIVSESFFEEEENKNISKESKIEYEIDRFMVNSYDD